MSRVRTRDTDLEQLVAEALRRQRLRFEVQARDLPGRPDIVFRGKRVAVFIDGDFWHGFRFPLWRARLAPFWQEKIEMNRRRDRRNFAALRRVGWRVIRFWQHQLRRDTAGCIYVVVALLSARKRASRSGVFQRPPRRRGSRAQGDARLK